MSRRGELEGKAKFQGNAKAERVTLVQDRLPPHVRQRVRARYLRLRDLGYPTYRDYLKSPAWAKVKARYRASDRPQACDCGERRVDLHHLTYERVGGEELLEDLAPLCRHCHAMVHVLEARGDISLDMANLHDPERQAEHAAGLLEEQERREALRDAFEALPHKEQFNRLVALDSDGQYTKHLGRHFLKARRNVAWVCSEMCEATTSRRKRYLARNLNWSLQLHIPLVVDGLLGAMPSAIDLLMDSTNAQTARLHIVTPEPNTRPDTPMVIGPDVVLDCEGGYCCECGACQREREALQRRGVRSLRPTYVKRRAA